MRFVSLRDLRSRTAAIRKDLAAQHEIVLTANGRPIAILTGVNEDDFERRLSDLRRSRARAVLSRIREKASEKGTDLLTMGEIDAVVAKARRGRRGRK